MNHYTTDVVTRILKSSTSMSLYFSMQLDQSPSVATNILKLFKSCLEASCVFDSSSTSGRPIQRNCIHTPPKKNSTKSKPVP
jgi:hypothetical protein